MKEMTYNFEITFFCSKSIRQKVIFFKVTKVKILEIIYILFVIMCSCPLFCNELGGENDRIVSLTRDCITNSATAPLQSLLLTPSTNSCGSKYHTTGRRKRKTKKKSTADENDQLYSDELNDCVSRSRRQGAVVSSPLTEGLTCQNPDQIENFVYLNAHPCQYLHRPTSAATLGVVEPCNNPNSTIYNTQDDGFSSGNSNPPKSLPASTSRKAEPNATNYNKMSEKTKSKHKSAPSDPGVGALLDTNLANNAPQGTQTPSGEDSVLQSLDAAASVGGLGILKQELCPYVRSTLMIEELDSGAAYYRTHFAGQGNLCVNKVTHAVTR